MNRSSAGFRVREVRRPTCEPIKVEHEVANLRQRPGTDVVDASDPVGRFDLTRQAGVPGGFDLAHLLQVAALQVAAPAPARCSIASNSALKFPSPNPVAPSRWMISAKSVGRSERFSVKT